MGTHSGVVVPLSGDVGFPTADVSHTPTSSLGPRIGELAWARHRSRTGARIVGTGVAPAVPVTRTGVGLM